MDGALTRFSLRRDLNHEFHRQTLSRREISKLNMLLMGMTWGQNPLMTLRNSETLLQESVSQEINILSRKNILDIHIQNASLLLKKNKPKDLPIKLCFAFFCLLCALGGSCLFLCKLLLSFFFLQEAWSEPFSSLCAFSGIMKQRFEAIILFTL